MTDTDIIERCENIAKRVFKDLHAVTCTAVIEGTQGEDGVPCFKNLCIHLDVGGVARLATRVSFIELMFSRVEVNETIQNILEKMRCQCIPALRKMPALIPRVTVEGSVTRVRTAVEDTLDTCQYPTDYTYVIHADKNLCSVVVEVFKAHDNVNPVCRAGSVADCLANIDIAHQLANCLAVIELTAAYEGTKQ